VDFVGIDPISELSFLAAAAAEKMNGLEPIKHRPLARHTQRQQSH